MKVYVVLSRVLDGLYFCENISVNAYATHNQAVNRLNADAEETYEKFKEYYDAENIVKNVYNDSITISGYCDDYWSGEIYEKEIDDVPIVTPSEILTALNEVFDDYDDEVLNITDFGNKFNGALITHISRVNHDTFQFWSGDPIEDDDAEEIIVDENMRQHIYSDVINYL